MKGQKGEEKLVFYAGGGKDSKKRRKLLLIGSGIFGGFFLFVAVMTFISAEWAAAIVFLFFSILAVAFFLFAWFFDRKIMRPAYKRIEFYSDRVVFWHEQAWAWPSMEARYEDIRGACINKADEYGDHVRARGRCTDYDVDTLCVYCKNGEYILFGVHKWGEEYSRRILDEILRRADAPESVPEEGEYGSGSDNAKEGFSALGVEEEPEPEDDPQENRFDIEMIVGCEVYTEKGIRIGKIVDVFPEKTDIYRIETGSKEIDISVEEDLILEMDVQKKKIVFDSDKYFAQLQKNK